MYSACAQTSGMPEPEGRPKYKPALWNVGRVPNLFGDHPAIARERRRPTRRRNAWRHHLDAHVSPARKWIAGSPASNAAGPPPHQYNRELPWDSIDMDFMNLNQSAHGDREFGYIVRRAAPRVARWSSATGQDHEVLERLDVWSRAACALRRRAAASKIVRFGGMNMRDCGWDRRRPRRGADQARLGR